jgi:hypothetical protein
MSVETVGTLRASTTGLVLALVAGSAACGSESLDLAMGEDLVVDPRLEFGAGPDLAVAFHCPNRW